VRSASSLSWVAMAAAGAVQPAAVRARAPLRLALTFVTVGRALPDRGSLERAATHLPPAVRALAAPTVMPPSALAPAPRLVLSRAGPQVRPGTATRKPAAAAPEPAFFFVTAGAAEAARAAAAAQASRPKVEAPWAPLVLRSSLWSTPVPGPPLRLAVLPPRRAGVRG
jgi:hypothetical protein